MEGVGARLGRSVTRYGPATVFNGPVRKWKKKWVHVSPSSAAASNSSSNHSQTPNGTSNGNNSSHLLLYKWTPITQSQNHNNGNNNNNGDNYTGKEETVAAAMAAPEEPPRRKFKYVPIAVLEEQKNEAAEKVEDEAKSIDADPSTMGPTRKGEISDEKPDINDLPMEESQNNNQVVRQDLNESTLDLSLGLTSHDDERDSDSKINQMRDGQ